LSEAGAASPALTPPPGNPRFPLNDALRGLGCLAVVLAHSYGHEFGGAPHVLDNFTEQLGSAVQMFFALSGFLLFRPYLAAQATGGPALPLREYLVRRALRIIPGYWFALTVLSLFLGPDRMPGTFGSHWWLFYGFGQAYSVTENFDALAVAWTLSVEVTFYLLLPFFVLASRALGARYGWKRGALIVIAPLFVIGPVIHVLNTITTFDHGTTLAIQRVTYGLPGESNFFAIGMLLAVLSVAIENGERAPRALAWLIDRPRTTWRAAAALWLLAAVAFGFPHELFLGLGFRARFIGTDLVVMALVFLLLVPCVFDRHDTPVRRLLAWRPVVLCGVVSYGVYLWHFPLLQWMQERAPLHEVAGWPLAARVPVMFAVATAVSVVVATISYRFVELPYLRMKRGSGRPA
jgi:peptidoglycan/LPS O-acetylase OafA/YrhL